MLPASTQKICPCPPSDEEGEVDQPGKCGCFVTHAPHDEVREQAWQDRQADAVAEGDVDQGKTGEEGVQVPRCIMITMSALLRQSPTGGVCL